MFGPREEIGHSGGDRAELHKTVWRASSAGSSEGGAQEAATFDYATLNDEEAESDREILCGRKGFFIRPPTCLGTCVGGR